MPTPGFEGDEYINDNERRQWIHDGKTWVERPFRDRFLCHHRGSVTSWQGHSSSRWQPLKYMPDIPFRKVRDDTKILIQGFHTVGATYDERQGNRNVNYEVPARIHEFGVQVDWYNTMPAGHVFADASDDHIELRALIPGTNSPVHSNTGTWTTDPWWANRTRADPFQTVPLLCLYDDMRALKAGNHKLSLHWKSVSNNWIFMISDWNYWSVSLWEVGF
jgi:hypothetical protein